MIASSHQVNPLRHKERPPHKKDSTILNVTKAVGYKSAYVVFPGVQCGPLKPAAFLKHIKVKYDSMTPTPKWNEREGWENSRPHGSVRLQPIITQQQQQHSRKHLTKM